jgi:hypothetical protein
MANQSLEIKPYLEQILRTKRKVIMNTDFDIIKNKDLFAPVVFRSDFNGGELIDANQAWSLFFTAGKDDKTLGFEPEVGRFFTNILIAVGVAGSIWGLLFTSLV